MRDRGKDFPWVAHAPITPGGGAYRVWIERMASILRYAHSMSHLSVVLGDITEQHVDVIVNAANRRMRGGGGVDGAIHRAGGPAVLADCIERFPTGLATGDAGYTTAGNMAATWVVHTVGPNYGAGERDPELLRSCYRRSLEVADELGARSIAFPLISAGIYRWPLEDAISVAVSTLRETETSIPDIRIVVLDPTLWEKVQRAVDEVQKNAGVNR